MKFEELQQRICEIRKEYRYFSFAFLTPDFPWDEFDRQKSKSSELLHCKTDDCSRIVRFIITNNESVSRDTLVLHGLFDCSVYSFCLDQKRLWKWVKRNLREIDFAYHFLLSTPYINNIKNSNMIEDYEKYAKGIDDYIIYLESGYRPNYSIIKIKEHFQADVEVMHLLISRFFVYKYGGERWLNSLLQYNKEEFMQAKHAEIIKKQSCQDVSKNITSKNEKQLENPFLLSSDVLEELWQRMPKLILPFVYGLLAGSRK